MSALPIRRTITLGGKEFELRELQFGDYADLQDLDVDLHELAAKIKEGGKATFRQLGMMLWVCCRKRATPEEAWRPTKEHFLHSFTMAEFAAAAPLITDLVIAPLAQPKVEAESTG